MALASFPKVERPSFPSLANQGSRLGWLSQGRSSVSTWMSPDVLARAQGGALFALPTTPAHPPTRQKAKGLQGAKDVVDCVTEGGVLDTRIVLQHAREVEVVFDSLETKGLFASSEAFLRVFLTHACRPPPLPPPPPPPKNNSFFSHSRSIIFTF